MNVHGVHAVHCEHREHLSEIIMYSTSQKYKYSLDTSSRKYVCPRCGKRTFVLYLDDSKQPLSDEVGRCDRKDKCGWHYAPREYFQDRQSLNESEKKMDKRPRQRPKPIPPDFISPDLFSSTLKGYEHNSLMRFLHSVFDRLIGEDAVNRVAMEYAVGTSNQFGGSPVFWQIDEHGKIRTGKVMGYNATSGKRVKEPYNQFKWVHKIIEDQHPDFRLQQCFFGSHRLITSGKKLDAVNQERKALSLDEVNPIIGLFESEKACLIVAMALVWGNAENLFIPVSCGSYVNFNPTDEKKHDPYDGIRLLKDRRVVVFCDEGMFGDWMQKAQALKGFSSEVYVSSVMEKDKHPHKVQCDYEEGDALDDLILNYIRDGKDVSDVADLILTSYGYHQEYKIV